eukprot:scaffold12764_cov20-Tisochrysis_lutea.AAC.2
MLGLEGMSKQEGPKRPVSSWVRQQRKRYRRSLHARAAQQRVDVAQCIAEEQKSKRKPEHPCC